MFFIDNSFEIFTVASVRDVDIDVAYNMFRTDVKAGKAQSFNTGDALPDVDFAALKEEWDALSGEERGAAEKEWHAFLRKYYVDACAVFAAGRDALSGLAEQAVAEGLDDEDEESSETEAEA